MAIADLQVALEDLERCDWQAVIAACDKKTYHAYFPALNSAAGEAETSGNLACSNAFRLLAAAALLQLQEDPKRPFGPVMEMAGQRTTIAEDFTDAQLGLFAPIVPRVQDAEFRARLADIVWVRKHNHLMAAAAVDAYLASAHVLEDPVHWTECTERIQRALQIASSSRRSDLLQQVVAFIEELLHKYRGMDPSFLSCKLMELLQEKHRGDPMIYAPMADAAASRAEQQHEWWRAYAYLRVLARWYGLAKNLEAERATWLRYAEDQVKEADDALSRPASPYGVAAHFLQQAIEVLRNKVPGTKKRQQELHKRLLDYQQRSVAELKPVPIEMDLSDVADQARRAVSGRPFIDALLKLADITPPITIKQLVEYAEQYEKDSISRIFPRVTLSNQGKVAARQPPAIGNPEEVDEARLATMFHDAVLCREVIARGAVAPALQQIGHEHPLDVAALQPLVSPFIPEGYTEIVSRGLHAGLLGDFLVATHLLVPQLEQAIRTLLAGTGAITSSLSNSSIQNELTLEPLLKMPELEHALGPNMVFDLRGLLVEQHGSNLRNLVAHGLLDFNAFFSGPAMYFWWLMLRLCCASYTQSIITTIGAVNLQSARDTAPKETSHDDVTGTLKEFESTDDTTNTIPDAAGLFAAASEQMGYFTTAQARSLGYSLPLLSYYVRTGRFLRVRRGLYRLRDYPSSPNEEVMAAWLTIGKDRSVISHESALALLGLSDVVPNAIHVLVPRSRRGLQAGPVIALHTTTHPLRPGDVVVREGIHLTAPGRTILDVAETGTASEQVIMAIEQARKRGWLTEGELQLRAHERGGRVATLVEQALRAA